MACETRLLANQTLAQRVSQIDAALKRLEAYLQAGRVQIGIGPTGAIMFKGWQDRDDVTDACAYRTLTSQSSWALRQAVARAEATTGRKVNTRAIAAGVHSHDGKTWGKH